MFFRAAAAGVEENPIYRRVREGFNPDEIAGREWIERGWLPVGEEYWVEDSTLLATNHF
jgi:hypothetical protein